jgi:hypothetical protein
MSISISSAISAKGLFWAAAAVGILSATSVLAAPPVLNSYSYWARIPQTSQSCGQEASRLGSRFAKVTQLQVTDAKCDGVSAVQVNNESVNLYSLEVTYLAQSPIQTYTAMFGQSDIEQSNVPTDDQGLFSTASACQAEIAKQSQLFEKQTGLGVLSARCELNTWSPSNSFVLNIEGYLGSAFAPAQFLQVANFAQEGKAGIALQDHASNLISSGGGVIAGTWLNSVYFYAAQTLPLKFFWFGDFTPSQCAAQLPEAQGIYSNLSTALKSPVSSTVRCIPDGTGNVSLESAYVADPLIMGDFGAQSAPYYSYNDCMANLDRTVDAAVAQGTQPPLGALCTSDALNPGQYLVILYSAEITD